MAGQAAFEAFASRHTRPYDCTFPPKIVSSHRDLDFTQCFEHAVLLPVPLAFFTLLALFQIFRITKQVKKGGLNGGLAWITRSRRSERICSTKVVRWLPCLCVIMTHFLLGHPHSFCPLLPGFIMPYIQKHLCKPSFRRPLPPAFRDSPIAYPPHHFEPSHFSNFIDYYPPFLSYLSPRIYHPP